MRELYLRQWCQYRQVTLAKLSDKTSINLQKIESVQNGSLDPSLTLMETIAQELAIPTSWLHYDPQILLRVWNDTDDEEPELPTDHDVDPIFERMIQVRHAHPELFVLLTNLVHHGDPKLIRAAQVNLQSLAKQIRPTTLPWGSRPPGHFEPPSD
jgi:transcriptional regulator with XRE-family HTH domain